MDVRRALRASSAAIWSRSPSGESASRYWAHPALDFPAVRLALRAAHHRPVSLFHTCQPSNSASISAAPASSSIGVLRLRTAVNTEQHGVTKYPRNFKTLESPGRGRQDMRDQERVGTRIATLRKARGLTQRQLAERASVSYSLLT